MPDSWLENGYPWEVKRPEDAIPVQFGGRVEQIPTPDGKLHCVTRDAMTVLAVPYDVPIVGSALQSRRMFTVLPP